MFLVFWYQDLCSCCRFLSLTEPFTDIHLKAVVISCGAKSFLNLFFCSCSKLKENRLFSFSVPAVKSTELGSELLRSIRI